MVGIAGPPSTETSIIQKYKASVDGTMPIVPLGSSVASKIHAQRIAPDLGSVLLQLIYNSLDANASNISIKVDLQNFMLQVRDDGDGMTLADLQRCGQQSSTSKLQSQSQLQDPHFPTHGFRGESLASISEFCLLDIVSTSRRFPNESTRKVFSSKNGATISRLPCPTSVGTTVTCRDLFYNRPVVRKMHRRALHAAVNPLTGAASSSGRSGREALLDKLVSVVRGIAVINASKSFALYDAARLEPACSIARAPSLRAALARLVRGIGPDALVDLRADAPRDASPSPSRCALSLWSHPVLSLGSAHRRCAMELVLCSPTAPTLPRSKDAQLVFVNGRLVARCPVHKLLSSLYKAALGAAGAEDAAAKERASPPQRADAGGVAALFQQRKRRRVGGSLEVSAGKLARRYAVFAVALRLPPADCAFAELDGVTQAYLATWDPVLEAISALAAPFFRLDEEHGAEQPQSARVAAAGGSAGQSALLAAWTGAKRRGGEESASQRGEDGRHQEKRGGQSPGGSRYEGEEWRAMQRLEVDSAEGRGARARAETEQRRAERAPESAEEEGGIAFEEVDAEEMHAINIALNTASMEASRARAVRDGATSALALVSSEITRAKADADQWHARRKGWITGAQRHGAGACAGPRGNERERERDRASSVGTPQSAGEAWRREVEDKSDSRMSLSARPSGRMSLSARPLQYTTVFDKAALCWKVVPGAPARPPVARLAVPPRRPPVSQHFLPGPSTRPAQRAPADPAPAPAPALEGATRRADADASVALPWSKQSEQDDTRGPRLAAGSVPADHAAPPWTAAAAQAPVALPRYVQTRSPHPKPSPEGEEGEAAEAEPGSAWLVRDTGARSRQHLGFEGREQGSREPAAGAAVEEEAEAGEGSVLGVGSSVRVSVDAGNDSQGRVGDKRVRWETGDVEGKGAAKKVRRELWAPGLSAASSGERQGEAATEPVLVEAVEAWAGGPAETEGQVTGEVAGAAWNGDGLVLGTGSGHRILSLDSWDGVAKKKMAVSKAMLEGARAVGQLLDKFVVLEVGGQLMLLDQHAADERIRLEKILAALAPAATGRARAARLGQGRHGPELWDVGVEELSPGVLLDALPPREVTLLRTFRDQVAAWGFVVKPVPAPRAGDDVFRLVGVPSVMGHALGLEELIEYLHELGAGAGSRGRMPESVLRVVVSKACRGAIMFGDPLAPTQREQLLSSLKRCKLPFQCAHGRPSLVPLLDLAGWRQRRGQPQATLDGEEDQKRRKKGKAGSTSSLGVLFDLGRKPEARRGEGAGPQAGAAQPQQKVPVSEDGLPQPDWRRLRAAMAQSKAKPDPAAPLAARNAAAAGVAELTGAGDSGDSGGWGALGSR